MPFEGPFIEPKEEIAQQGLPTEIDIAQFENIVPADTRVVFTVPEGETGFEKIPEGYEVTIDTDGELQRVSVNYETIDGKLMETVIKDNEGTGDRIFTGIAQEVTPAEAQKKRDFFDKQALNR